MKVLVTGGAGFIGSHVTSLLCDKNFTVRVVDDLRFGYKKFVDKRAEFIELSLSDETRLRRALKDVDAVIHLAASSIISASYENPIEYFNNNVGNGIILLDAMRKMGVNKMIYSSTAAVYGEPKRSPVSEEDPAVPINIYGASKLAFEHVLRVYYRSYGIESVALRYFNAYGPRDEQIPRTRALPMWIEAMLQSKPIPWYWNGSQTRDFIYVRDVAEAHIAVMNLSGYHIFNIGSGHGVQMKTLLEHIERIHGHKIHTVDMGKRPGDPMELVADITKITRQTGWTPRVSLADGLRKTYEYYKKEHENTH